MKKELNLPQTDFPQKANMRNTFKYLLSNLFDYDDTYVPVELCAKDQKALESLWDYKSKMLEAYESYG